MAPSSILFSSVFLFIPIRFVLVSLLYQARTYFQNKRCAPRPLPSVAGAKTKNFPSFLLDFRGGVWGEPTKNGKEIFGFASPLQKLRKEYHLILLLLITLFSVSSRRYEALPLRVLW